MSATSATMNISSSKEYDGPINTSEIKKLLTHCSQESDKDTYIKPVYIDGKYMYGKSDGTFLWNVIILNGKVVDVEAGIENEQLKQIYIMSSRFIINGAKNSLLEDNSLGFCIQKC